MSNNFVIVDKFKTTKKLVDICKAQTNFQQGHSKYGTLWTVWECPLMGSPIWDEVKELFSVEPSNVMLSKTGREGLPRHFDINKWSVLNIPISGNFVESPLVFVDDMDNIIESSTYCNGTTPVLFDARSLHAVLPSNLERLVLSICWKKPYEFIKAKYLNDELLKNYSGEFFSAQ